jgi:hypothetical protein
VGQPVGGRAGLDDLSGEGEPVDDGRAEPRVGEGLGPAGERLVRGDGDCRSLFSLGEYLEELFGAAAVEFQISQLINLCGHPHSGIHADTATMPRVSVAGSHWVMTPGFLVV